DGTYGKGVGYVAGFGHGAPDQKGTDADGNEYTIPNPHNCGSFIPGTDIKYGPSSAINYTITVSFKNATFSHKNYDGVSASAEYFTEHEKVGDGTKLPAHALCGSCCENTLPQVVDTWTQKLRYDTVRFTAYILPSTNAKELTRLFHGFCVDNGILSTPDACFAYMRKII
ncbi:hypothetical protein SAMN05216391_1563, partial [Lachnospiraceae bacterium KHCPX20]